jgi:hypothetical protein
MISVYLADMRSIKQTYPEIYKEFAQGNCVVNKNNTVPFCFVGADHALEHVNRSMKVPGGLVGITLNPSAHTKFFLISPELARLAGEAQSKAGVSSPQSVQHHALSDAKRECQERNVAYLTSTLISFTNPFSEEVEYVLNLITKVVMVENVKQDLCSQHELGITLLHESVTTRIQSDGIHL